jgi:hypothetical protein
MTLPRLLLLFGVGFLAATARAVYLHLRYLSRRRGALLLWPGQKPPFFGMQIGIAVALGLLLAYNLAFRQLPPVETLFGEAMMFLYYAYAVPMTARIPRGVYADGVWSDRAFVRFASIGGISWREGKDPVLLLATEGGGTARTLTVPGQHYGAVRRLLRDLISEHRIRLSGHGLDLGVKDEREDA